MKKALILALAMTVSTSLAAPFVFPAAWSTNKPSEVKTGGTYRNFTLADFKTLNPFVAKESPQLTNEGILAPNGGLLTFDPAKDDYVPYMAESYSVGADRVTFTVKVRKGMKWSDGNDITADDFMTAYTIHRDEKVGSNSYSGWYPNDKPILVKKIDQYTLQVKFPFPDVTAIENLAGFFPEPSHVFDPVYKAKGAEGIKDMWTISTDPKKIVSAGPFVLDKYAAGERVTLKRNPYYGEWNKDSAGKPLPYLDAETYLILKDQNAALAEYLAGNLDEYAPDNRDRLAQVKAAIDGKKIDANLIVNASARASSDFVAFNMDNASSFKGKLFRNAKFRQAFSMIVNRDAMVDLVLGGLGQPTYTGVYPVYKEWIYQDADKYKYNPAAASKLLAEIGFTKKDKDGYLIDSKGNRLEFTLMANAENTRRQQYAKIIQDEAKKVGIKINTSFIAFNQMTSLLDATDGFKPRNFDAIMIGLVGGGRVYPVSGDNVVTCTNLPDGGNLHMFNQTNKCLFPWETQEVNLYYKGRGEFDTAKRRAIAFQIQKIEVEQQPYTQLAAQTVHYSWLNKVQGEFPRPLISSLNGTRAIDLTWMNK